MIMILIIIQKNARAAQQFWIMRIIQVDLFEMPVPEEISGFPPSSQLLTSGIYGPVILGPEARYLL